MCGGATCSEGLCSTSVVARSAARIDAFVTDGNAVFTIDANAARACDVASGASAACREIVTGEAVGARMMELGADFSDWGSFGGGKPGPKKGLVGLRPLSPRAIALGESGRVVIADDAYKVLVACPASGPCTRNEMSLVDASWSGEGSQSLGRSLALGPGAVVWTQGDALRSAPLPAPGTVAKPIAEREDDSTEETQRVAAPGATELLWLSETGLHHAAHPGAPSEHWFSRSARDFAFDAASVHLASAEGLFRVSRKDASAALTASGSFELVAVDARGVFATKVEGSRRYVVEARAGKLLTLAVVDGTIDGLAVAGAHVYFMTRVGEGSEIHRVAR